MNTIQLTGIKVPHENDVLLGRGNFANLHQGNKQFRAYVSKQKEIYVHTEKSDKPIFARMIVNTIRALVPPGRFLKQDPDTQLWEDIGDKKAWNKTRQALREDAPKMKQTLIESPSDINNPCSSHPPVGGHLTEIAPYKYLCSMLDSQLQASVVGPIFGNNQLECQIPTRGCYNGIHSTNISATPNALWHTESKVFNDNGDTRSGENLLESSISPTLLKSSRESFVKQLAETPISPKHVTNINISNDANNIEPVVCNHHRSAYTRRRSSMKRPAKYTDNSLSGTLSSTGLSSITDRFSAETGSTSDMNQNKNTKISNDSTAIGSGLFEDFCTSALSKKEDEFDNSLYFEGMLAPQLDIADVIRAIDEDDEEKEEEKLISYIKMLDEKLDENKIPRSESESNLISNRQLEDRKLFGLNDGTSMSDKLEATILSSISSLSDKSLSGARLILATKRLSDIMSTRTSIGSWAPSHEISEGNKDDHSSANRHGSPNRLSCTSTKLDYMLSHASSSSSSSSQMNLVPCSLDDLSNFSGRMSICDNMTFADPKLFGMNKIELIDWQKEAHEWEMEVEM